MTGRSIDTQYGLSGPRENDIEYTSRWGKTCEEHCWEKKKLETQNTQKNYLGSPHLDATTDFFLPDIVRVRDLSRGFFYSVEEVVHSDSSPYITQPSREGLFLHFLFY